MMKKILLSFSLMVFIGCAAKYNNTLSFSPTEPLRVAVLPFVQVNDEGAVVEPDAGLLIDNVGLVSSKLPDTPAAYTRKLVQNELSKTSLDLIAPAVVDAKLSHAGFSKSDLSIDAAKALHTSASEICSKVLACDAVLYGRVKKWNRTYLAIQTVNTVSLELSLVSARDGKVLFQTTAEDSDSRGITKGPTGFSNLVLEPIRGLDNKIITDLAQKVVENMIAPLHVETRPEFLQSSPPAVFASSHDAQNGLVKTDSKLTVVMYGSAKDFASFSIGNAVEHLPMIEQDPGHYIGEFYPLASDSFANQPVTVYLTDEFGRTTEQRLGNSTISVSKKG